MVYHKLPCGLYNGVMRWLLVTLIIIALLVSACDDAGPDLVAQAEIAAVTVAQATKVAQHTQDAQAELDRQSTLQAAATRQASQDEIAAIEAQIRGTQEAVHGVQTVAAITVQAEDRATRAALISTVQAITATPLRATQIAIVKAASIESTRANIRLWGSNVVLPVVLIGLFGWGIAVLVIALSRRIMTLPTPGGVAFLAGKPTMLPLDATWRDVNTTDDLVAQAIELIQASIKAGGERGGYGNKIAGWRNVPGWSSSKWQYVIRALEYANAVYTEPQKGTFVKGDWNLNYLLWQLQSGEIEVTPPP